MASVALGMGVPAHPRSRGENARAAGETTSRVGSSPLARGKLRRGGGQDRRRELIPARAGKTRWVWRGHQGTTAHPRSRGENRRNLRRPALALGLIPARAGKTDSPILPAPWWAAHPRSRGENGMRMCSYSLGMGSSPLARGKPQVNTHPPVRCGLIPARAGKTSPRRG